MWLPSWVLQLSWHWCPGPTGEPFSSLQPLITMSSALQASLELCSNHGVASGDNISFQSAYHVQRACKNWGLPVAVCFHPQALRTLQKSICSTFSHWPPLGLPLQACNLRGPALSGPQHLCIQVQTKAREDTL